MGHFVRNARPKGVNVEYGSLVVESSGKDTVRLNNHGEYPGVLLGFLRRQPLRIDRVSTIYHALRS